MRGQVAIAVVATILAITLIMLITLPKRTLGPEVAIEDYAIRKLEVQQMLNNAVEESILATAQMISNPSMDADSIKQAFTDTFNAIFTEKAGEYALIRNIRCDLAELNVDVTGSSVVYIKSIYAAVKCDDGITAYTYSQADVSVETKSLGFFGGVKATVQLIAGNRPVKLITYGAAFLIESQSAGSQSTGSESTGSQSAESQPTVVIFPALGGFSPDQAIWYFNVTGIHEIKIAVPPEFAQQSTCELVIAVASVGQGAGTIIMAPCNVGQ
ncbi:hypothetical protein TUZN_0925 [Thermoproteus uzoniensis 768-20]|uniref:Uncharacterized protein n=1 Tax=Thermoproteus uzoniensis (strain 768-20) TaxID=999630 RepID=F2L5W3_THEU7|nr:hypothetical protein [Thermoproteus uzoniensis]AEA12408.1 hypothetical protein TUZN_0925 [Thermoproteus uzoniensis 768-20]